MAAEKGILAVDARRQSTCREGGDDRQELRCLGDLLAFLGDTSTTRSIFLLFPPLCSQ